MNENYYFGNPQLFKMPRYFRTPGPPLTPSPIAAGKHSLSAFEEGSGTKALPYIVGGVALVIAYNMFFRKKGR